MRVALVSLNQAWLDKGANKDQCAGYIAEARGKSCDAVIFPEMTLSAYSMNTKEMAEPFDSSGTLKFFDKASKDHSIDIVFRATFAEQNGSAPSNALWLSTQNKAPEVFYEKTHPFSFAGEASCYKAGERLGLMRFAGMSFGAAICFDLRFPEIFSAMARDVDAFVVIANWPKKRIDHWFSLLKARAIENQCYVIGVNRVGIDGNGIEYEKSTVIFDPIGHKMIPVELGEIMDIYEINRNVVEKYRNEFPTIADKRYSFYQHLYEDLR